MMGCNIKVVLVLFLGSCYHNDICVNVYFFDQFGFSSLRL